MNLINQVRPEDNLADFGELIRFAALVYDNANEGEANCSFEPYNIDGDVAFPIDEDQANAAFDAWVLELKKAEDQFLEEGDEEGFVGLFKTPNGLMILAGTTIMGFPNPDPNVYLAGAKYYLAMPHVTWERIVEDMKL